MFVHVSRDIGKLWTQVVKTLCTLHPFLIVWTVFLRLISDKEILQMRLQGRKIWELHFSTFKESTNSLLTLLRVRLNIPALPAAEITSESYNTSISSGVESKSSDMQKPKRNFSLLNMDIYTHTPFEDPWPLDVQFDG